MRQPPLTQRLRMNGVALSPVHVAAPDDPESIGCSNSGGDSCNGRRTINRLETTSNASSTGPVALVLAWSNAGDAFGGGGGDA